MRSYLWFCCLLGILFTSTASLSARIAPNHHHEVTIAAAVPAATLATEFYNLENQNAHAHRSNVQQFAWLCVVPNANVPVDDNFRKTYCRRAVPIGPKGNQRHAEPQLFPAKLDALLEAVGRANAAYVFIYSWLIPCKENCAQLIADNSLRIHGIPFILYYHYGYKDPHPEYTQVSINILQNGHVNVYKD